ncbi:MAG: carboxypeptidase-like regulatory domain-containing protein [Cyclobacteriaceae bacterium]|nr:carboxypeptidase-like regulatory domain-containing protein [Cyclobacteriaceae bacterium]
MQSLKSSLLLTLCLLLSTYTLYSQKGSISGIVADESTGETIIGANVVIEGTTQGASTDLSGAFTISNVDPGTYNLRVSYIAYRNRSIEGVTVKPGETTRLKLEIKEDIAELEGIVVTGVRDVSTDLSVIKAIRESMQVVSGISAQSISRTMDSDAAQVVKRVPGVTVLGDRFIVVRGLNERYNQVLLHGVVAPSMEPDVRSFSFDVMPSNVIDQLLIYKSPSPDLAGDFSGGLIKVQTKSIPDETGTVLDISTAYRTGMSLRDFKAQHRRRLHWTGFNDGADNLPVNFPENLSAGGLTSAQFDEAGRSLPNNWKEETYNSGLDYKVSATHYFRRNLGKKSMQLGNITNLQYSNSKTIFNSVNRGYEAFLFSEDRFDLRYDFEDMEYGQEISLGIMHNWALRINDRHTIEIKNLYNRLTTFDFIDRFGEQVAQSFTQERFTFFNEYRGIYSGQLTGNHLLPNENTHAEWVIGYGTSFNELPDYRRYRTNVYDIETRSSELFIPRGQTPDFFGKFYSEMNETILSGGLNIDHTFNHKSENTKFKPVIKGGFYLESRQRSFSARNLGFRRANNAEFNIALLALPVEELFRTENINSTDGIRIGENFSVGNFFEADNELRAYYLSLNLPIWKFNLFGGVRIEDNVQRLQSPDRFQPGTSLPPITPVIIDQTDILPSVTLAYNINTKMLVKAVYGKTLNRPEFREIAPFGFYDFLFDATITGYSFLQNANIQNYDLRWEYYPSSVENISIAFFYKDFRNPIESLYGNFGSEQSTFFFRNTESAFVRGIEIDIRKSFSGLIRSKFFNNLSALANVSVIDSHVTLGDELSELLRAGNRPLQGQSDFIVNSGLFYDDPKRGLQINLLYNVIGKRILFVGAGEIPDTYEMPRNVIDISAKKMISQKLTLKAGIKDLLNQEFLLLQDGNEDGIFDRKNDQIFRRFQPGTSYSIGLTYQF